MQDWKNHIETLNPQMFPLFVRNDSLSEEPPSVKKRPVVHRRVMDLEGRFVVYHNMVEPDLTTGQEFVHLLKKNGIQLNGKIKYGKVSRSARLLTQIANPTSKLVSHMLKTSNNFYADLLVRNIPFAFGERPGSYATGIDFLTYYLDYANIPRTEYSINSGSGFSHQNMISPRAMVQLLVHLKNLKEIRSKFVSSLPIAGVDGTLRNRMQKTEAQNRIYAKTGYLRRVKTAALDLDGAVSLAGYATPPDSKYYVFAFFYNGLASPYTVRDTFDRICIEMIAPGKGMSKKVSKPPKKKAPVKKRTKKKKG
jgi:D-alanyl-D-alanine carboxypeptidase/D-alanyl-D-alanine-endopeptidase (penicillin-binding protein 4)